MAAGGFRSWRDATQAALYGPAGFFVREAPAAHFRTSVHASPVFAEAVLALARAAAVGAVLDVGAGRGELLVAVRRLAPELSLAGVELAARPPGLDAGIGWHDRVPAGFEGLVLANEWLDDVPVDVVEVGRDGLRLVEVDDDGGERLGPSPAPPDLDWLARWWPVSEVGERAEVGWPRDQAWAEVVAGVRRGLLVAVDYAHTRGARPSTGTLTGYRAGRQVPPVPDGTCDITSHVALDACAAAGEAAGATPGVLLTQRQALRALGVTARRQASEHQAVGGSLDLDALRRAGEAAELTDPGGLGGFTWLAQGAGVEVPAVLRDAPS